MKQTITIIHTILLFSVGIFAQLPGPGMGVKGGELKYGENEFPDSFDPFTSVQNSANIRLTELMFESLIDEDEFGDYIPELASELPTRAGNRVTINLKQGVTWHDGEAFDADDVKFTVEAYQNPQNITGPYWRSVIKKFKSCVVTTPYQVVFEIDDRTDDVAPLFMFKIIPEHAFNGNTSISKSNGFSRRPIGTGPYQFLINNDNEIRLKYFEAYHQGRANLDDFRMVYRDDPNTQVASLEADGLNTLVRIRNQDISRLSGNFNLRSYKSLNVSYIGYNLRHPVLRDQRIRWAISLGMDREYMLKTLYLNKGTLVSGPFPPGSPYYNRDITGYPYNVEEARGFLEKAGCQDSDGDGILELPLRGERYPLDFELSLEATGQNNSSVESVAEALVEYMSKIGIRLRIRHLDAAGLRAKVFSPPYEFDMVIHAWTFNEANDVSTLFSTGGFNNFVGFADPEIDKYFTAVRNTDDPEARRLLNFEIHNQLMKKCPYTFLWSLEAHAAFHKKIQGTQDIHPFRFFTYARNWWIPFEEQ